MNLREQFEKSDLCKTMVGNHEEVNLRRYADTPKEPYRGQYMWSRLEAAWQGFQSGHAAGLDAQERSIALLTQSRDRCIAENTRLAKRVAELDPANCHPMRLNAAMKEPK